MTYHIPPDCPPELLERLDSLRSEARLLAQDWTGQDWKEFLEWSGSLLPFLACLREREMAVVMIQSLLTSHVAYAALFGIKIWPPVRDWAKGAEFDLDPQWASWGDRFKGSFGRLGILVDPNRKPILVTN